MITVSDLIAHLQTFDPTLRVLFECHSDYLPLTLEDVRVNQAISQRPGSTSEFLRRVRSFGTANPHDMPPEEFLCFPGN